MKKRTMSDNAHRRMKGIIARKKMMLHNDPIVSHSGQEVCKRFVSERSKASFSSPRKQSELDLATIRFNYTFLDLAPCRNDNTTTVSPLKIPNKNIESDSSDSILDYLHPRQIRRRKYRRRTTKRGRKSRVQSIRSDKISESVDQATNKKKHKQLRRALSQHVGTSRVNLANGTSRNNLSTLNDYSTKEGYQYKSDTTTPTSSGFSSDLLIDTNNSILPSLVKKGIKYYDIPEIERTLARKSTKIHTMNQKQGLLDQLLEQCTLRNKEKLVTKKGVASVHKLGAERKTTVQYKFLHDYGLILRDPKERHSIAITSCLEDDNFQMLKYNSQQQEKKAPRANRQNSPESPSSLSFFSSFEEGNRFQKSIDKSESTIPHFFHRLDEEDQFYKPFDDQFTTTCSFSSPDKTLHTSKTSPFDTMEFSQSKEDLRYETPSPISSFCDNSWTDCDGLLIDTPTNSNNFDEVQLNASHYSEWSEMSFGSDPNKFLEASIAQTPESSKTLKRSNFTFRPRLFQLDESKLNNDSFDQIVIRNKPNSFGKHNSNRSPTCIIDFDSVDQVFTDKEDSLSISCYEQICTASAYQAVFFSPNRFEV